MSKGDGRYIAIKFDKPLTGDVSGLTPTPVGGYKFETDDDSLAVTTSSRTWGTNAGLVDSDITSFWGTSASSSWIRLDFGAGNAEVREGFRWYISANYRPRGVEVHGSNDASAWTELYEGESPNETGWHEFTFENDVAYRYYRISITSVWASYCWVYEVELGHLDPIGNEAAFGVSGQERDYILMPEEEDGPLVDGDYVVLSVEEHPTEPNAILLTMKEDKRFRNVSGDLTIDYDMTKGNLAGLGGAVVTFSESFTPADLVEEICRWWKPNPEETVTVAIEGLTLTRAAIEHQVVGEGPYPNEGLPNEEDYQGVMRLWGGDNNELIDVSITGLTLVLTHVDDLDP